MSKIYTWQEASQYSKNEWENRIERGSWWVEDVQQTPIDGVDMSDWLKHETVIIVMSLQTDIVVRTSYGNNVKADIPLDVKMTLRCELRGQMRQWYAYKKHAGKLRKLYFGHDEDICTERIVAIAKKFGGW